MNILFFHDKPSGGAGESLLQIIDSISDEHSAYIIFINEGFLKEKYDAIQDEVPIYYHSSRGSWLLNRDFRFSILNYGRFLASMPGRWKLIKFIIEKAKLHQIDVIYSNTIYLIEGAIAAKILGIPHIWQVRELYNLDYYQYCLPKKDVTKILGWFSKKVICNSNKTKQVLLDYKANAEKIEVLYNVVNPPKKEIDFRKKLRCADSTQLVAILGWITPNKMVENFIDVASHFSDNNIKFLIIGGYGGKDAYNTLIKEKIKQSPNNANIIETGILPNAVNYLSSIDILLCPCYTESFGRTVAEALIVGTPSIGIKNSATEELIQDKISGFIVNRSDVAKMIEHTTTLLEDDNLRSKMGAAGKDYILRHFSKKILQPKYHQLFNDVLK